MEVVVLGGGYAGVGLTRALEDRLPSDVELLLVDDTGDHLVQHELHRLLRYPGLRDTVRLPLERMFDRAQLRVGRVDRIDEEIGRAELADGRTLEPDILAICLGAVTALDVVPGIAEHGMPLKRLADADDIRDRFHSLAAGERVIVGGAGLSGVQVAGELAAARDAADRDLTVTVIEQEASVAPRFPNDFRREVATALSNAGIDVRTNTRIADVDEAGVTLECGEWLSTGQVIWTGGITGPDATENRRLRARSDLRVAPRTFAIGDAALVVDDRGKRVPAAAQTAIRQATVAAANVDRLVRAKRNGDELVFEPRLRRYVHRSPGWVVSIGDDAVAMVGDRILRGAPARAVKASVNAQYLGSVGEVQRALDAIATEIGWGAAHEH